MSNSELLKEMGITEWASRDQPQIASATSPLTTSTEEGVPQQSFAAERAPHGGWLFFGQKPQGDTQVLFQNIVRVLGLSPNEWSWKNASDRLDQITAPENGMPLVAFAFGGPIAQKITGERDALPQLRETVLALNTGNDDEIPVIASFDLSQAIAKPNEKALLWQDLLLAKSVLQNI